MLKSSRGWALAFGGLLSLSASAIFADAQTTPAQLKPIRAAYVPASMWLPAWVAKERGFFREARTRRDAQRRAEHGCASKYGWTSV